MRATRVFTTVISRIIPVVIDLHRDTTASASGVIVVLDQVKFVRTHARQSSA